MLRVGLATLRHFWAGHRTAWLVIAAWLFCVCLAFQLAPSGSMTVYVGPLAVFPFIIVFLYLVAMLGYGWDGDLYSGRTCFPSRLFLLPLSALDLVLWPMLLGHVVIAALWGCIDLFVHRRCGIELSWWWGPLQLMTTLAWMQALLWHPFRVKGARLFCIWLLITAMVGLFFVVERYELSRHVVAVGLLVALAGAWVTAYHGVRSARHEPEPTSWSFSLSDFWPSYWGRAEFRSCDDAQLWLDWKLLGGSLTLSCLANLVLLSPFYPYLSVPLVELLNTGILPSIPGLAVESQATLIWLAALTTAGPIYTMTALQVSACLPSSPTTTLSPFFSTRPLTNERFVELKYRGAVRVALAIWVGGVVILGTWLVLSERTIIFADLRNALGYSSMEVVGLVAGWLLFVLVVMWVSLTSAAFVNFAGRRWLVVLTTAVAVIAALVAQLYLLSADKWGDSWPTIESILPWLFGSLLAVRLVVLALTFGAFRRRTEPQPIAQTFVTWVILLTLLGAWGCYYFTSTTTGGLMWVLFIAVLLPMSRLLAGPILLDWNRHR